MELEVCNAAAEVQPRVQRQAGIGRAPADDPAREPSARIPFGDQSPGADCQAYLAVSRAGRSLTCRWWTNGPIYALEGAGAGRDGLLTSARSNAARTRRPSSMISASVMISGGAMTKQPASGRTMTPSVRPAS